MKTSFAFTLRLGITCLSVALLPHGMGQQAQADGPNLLPNGDFGKGLEGWHLNPKTPDATAILDTKELYNGHPSMRVEIKGAMHAADLERPVNVKTGTRYRLSGWVKAGKIVKPDGQGQRPGDAGAGFGVMGGYDTTKWVSDTNGWVQMSVEFDSKERTEVKVGTWLGHYGRQVIGTAWYADLALVELGPGKSLANAANSPVVRPSMNVPATPAPSDLAVMGDLVKANHGNLVFVSGANSAGSGFIVKIGAGNFLITNAHVAAAARGAAFKTLDGASVQAGAPAVAVDHDIFRMAVAPGGKPFEIMENVGANAAIGDEVAVLGNTEGAGVATGIKGRILGIGPNLVEVDAQFVPGNSGSPIIHLKTGKVIGVATYALVRRYDAATLRTAETPQVRRFGYRLDSVQTWQPVSLNVFAAEAAQMEGIEHLTEDLGKLVSDIAAHHKITPALHTNPVIKVPIDMWLKDQARQLSPSDRTMAEQNFVSRLKSACQTDLTSIRPHLSYDYFQRQLANEQLHRDSIASAFDKMFDKTADR